MTTLRSGSATDIGRVRTTNQDVALEDPDLFAVADGMGGHVGGEVAARTAVDTLRAAFGQEPTVEGLRRAVVEANEAVWRRSQTDHGLRGMGTTITASALVADREGHRTVALANVGDSRAYVYSRGHLVQVTADHSLAEEKVRQGELTEAEAAVHPHRHILTRALGISADVDVDLWELHLRRGDRILLCSDGLTNELTDEEISETLGDVTEPAEAARVLVGQAVDHGGNDNVTVVVVDVLAEDPVGGDPALAGDSVDMPASWSPGSGPEGGPAVMQGMPVGGDITGQVGAQSAASGPRLGGVATVERAAGTGPRGPAPASRPERPAVRARRDGRALRPSRQERRRRRRAAGAPRAVTVRTALFILLLLAVLAAAYAVVRWYGTDDWYVAVESGHLAIYQGRPGGFLWFRPVLVDRTRITSTEVLPVRLQSLGSGKQEPSLSAAKHYVTNLHREYLAQQAIEAGRTPSTTPSTTTTPSTSTTTTTTTSTTTTPSTTTTTSPSTTPSSTSAAP